VAKVFDYAAVVNDGMRVVHKHPGVVETETNVRTEMPAFDDHKSSALHSSRLCCDSGEIGERR